MKKRNLLLALVGSALLLTGCKGGSSEKPVSETPAVQKSFGFGSLAKYAATRADNEFDIETTVDYVAVVLEADVIKNLRLDTVQLYAKIAEEAVVLKTETNGDVKSKWELLDGYGMKVASPIEKEWYEQAASLVEYIKGKTVSEALGTAAKLANGAEVGCTMNIGGYRTALLEAEHTAFNSRK